MKILLVEDERRVSSFIKRGLEEQGNSVVQAFDGTTGLRLAGQDEFDIIILDVVMPGLNGIEVSRQLKFKQGDQTPIIMLTALGTTDDIVSGLESGADDYLTKPFKFRELLARINALTRRPEVREASSKLLKVQDLEMNLHSKEVRRNGIVIKLTAREYRLLEYLLRNKNRVMSRTDIPNTIKIALVIIEILIDSRVLIFMH